MDQLLSAILTVAVGLAVFLVGRRVTLWYFRINEGLAALQDAPQGVGIDQRERGGTCQGVAKTGDLASLRSRSGPGATGSVGTSRDT